MGKGFEGERKMRNSKEGDIEERRKKTKGERLKARDEAGWKRLGKML